MFGLCRPVVRHCEFGHFVGEGDVECEEGHPAVGGEDGPKDDGLLGQLCAAVQ